jgi:hypothetical protein
MERQFTLGTQTSKRDLPIGSPMIMMGFTKDGQLKPELLKARDERFDVSTEEIKKKRADIPMPNVDPMANAWEKDKKNVRQFVITNKADSAMHMHQGAAQSEKH